jgi:hypothetical protein
MARPAPTARAPTLVRGRPAPRPSRLSTSNPEQDHYDHDAVWPAGTGDEPREDTVEHQGGSMIRKVTSRGRRRCWRRKPEHRCVLNRGGGKPQYHPHLMLALLVYCYANSLFSSRQIDRPTKRRSPGSSRGPRSCRVTDASAGQRHRHWPHSGDVWHCVPSRKSRQSACPPYSAPRLSIGPQDPDSLRLRSCGAVRRRTNAAIPTPDASNTRLPGSGTARMSPNAKSGAFCTEMLIDVSGPP